MHRVEIRALIMNVMGSQQDLVGCPILYNTSNTVGIMHIVSSSQHMQQCPRVEYTGAIISSYYNMESSKGSSRCIFGGRAGGREGERGSLKGQTQRSIHQTHNNTEDLHIDIIERQIKKNLLTGLVGTTLQESQALVQHFGNISQVGHKLNHIHILLPLWKLVKKVQDFSPTLFRVVRKIKVENRVRIIGDISN